MADFISRQAVLDWLNDEWDGMVLSVFDGIRALPSAQPERKTGKWNRRKGMYEIGFKCSECNMFSIAETPYCSFCGSHMVQEGEDNADTNSNHGRLPSSR